VLVLEVVGSGVVGKCEAETSGDREVMTWGRGGLFQIEEIGGGGESGSSLITGFLIDAVD
jgi:hypothetical protein